jgi:putative flippase GtrA
MKDKAQKVFDKVFFGFGIHSQVLRYLFGGGTAFLVDVGALYLFRGVIGWPLLVSVALSFLCGFAVSFTAQKFWTFGDRSYDRIHKQASAYFGLTLTSFFINIVAMHVLVTIIGVWYILAKILISALLAVAGFFMYKYVIFKRRADDEPRTV